MAFGPAEVDQRVERRARRPAGVEHVVDEQDLAVVDREGDLGAAHERLRPDGVAHQVVAIERDVERAGRHVVAGDVLERAGHAPGDRHAARAHADQGQIFDAFVAFDDFVGDAGEGAADAVRIHDEAGMCTSLRPHRTAVKESAIIPDSAMRTAILRECELLHRAVRPALFCPRRRARPRLDDGGAPPAGSLIERAARPSSSHLRPPHSAPTGVRPRRSTIRSGLPRGSTSGHGGRRRGRRSASASPRSAP